MTGTRRRFLAASAALGLAGRPSRAGVEEFRAAVAALSDPESGPAADNLVSNEDSYPRVAAELSRVAPPGGVYLGVGPDQNFTLIAHAKPSRAFILDFRRRNLLLHLIHKALFSLSADRAAYLSRLTARRPAAALGAEPGAAALAGAFGRGTRADPDALAACVAEVAGALRPLGVVAEAEWPAIATIQSRLAGPGLDARFLGIPTYPTLARLMTTPGHLLGDEASYRAVRGLHRADRIVPLVGDFAAPAPLPRLGHWLRGRGLAVGVVYISDVEFFLLRGGRFAAYVEGLARLPLCDGSVIVRTSTRPIASRDRVAGDATTTILRPLAPFLADARAGRVRSVDDLFR